MTMCNCFDCLRAEGITDLEQRDCLGFPRFPPDGRFTMGKESVKIPTADGEGQTTIKVDSGKPGRFIGT